MLLDEQNKPNKRGVLESKPLLIFLWAAFPIVVLFGISLGTAGNANPSEELVNNMSIWLISFVQFLSVLILFVGPAFLLAYLYKRDVLSFFNLRKKPSLKMVLLVIALIISANTFLNFLVDINELIPLPSGLEEKFRTMHDATVNSQNEFMQFTNVFEFLLVFFIAAILPALAEEMYFRGLIQGVLSTAKLAPVHAIFIASFLFALVHFEFYYLLPLLFMGLLLGYIYYRTKNLWLSIAAHLFNNGLIVLLTASNKIKLTNIDLDATPSIFVSTIGLAVFMALIYIFTKQTTESKF